MLLTKDKIVFENLIDIHTGESVEVEYKNPSDAELKNLNEIMVLGQNAARSLRELFKEEQN